MFKFSHIVDENDVVAPPSVEEPQGRRKARQFVRLDRSAFRAAIWYLAFATIWILTSDNLLEAVIQDQTLITKYQTYKGIAFVTCTTCLVYLLVHLRTTQLAAAQDFERAAALELQSVNERRALAFAAAQLGEWSYDIKADRFRCDDRATSHFGFASGARMSDVLARIHSEDRPLVEQMHAQAIAGHGVPHCEFRIARDDGGFAWIAVSALGKRAAGDDRRVTELMGTCQDIDARKKAVQDALESATLLKLATEATGLGLVVLDSNRRYTFANPAYSKILNLPPAIIGQRPADLMPEVYTEQIAPNLARAFAGERVVYELNRRTETDPQFRSYSVIYEPLLVQPGCVENVVAVIIETTELRKSERALRESEQRLKYALESTGEGIWDWDLITNRVKHNPQWCGLLGLDADSSEHMIDSFIERVHADDRAMVQRHLAACIEERVPLWCEFRLQRMDGRIIWVLDRGDVVARDASGKALRMVGSFGDISERKFAQQRNDKLLADLIASEAESQRQKALFQSVFESSPAGLVIADIDRKIMRINPALSQMFGYPIDSLEGRSTEVLYASAHDFSIVGDYLALSTRTEPLPIVHFARANGDRFPARLTAAYMRDEHGAIIGYVGVIQDVSIELKRDQALREKQRLEALGRLSGGIAHDFNNMLTVITGNLQLIDFETHDPAIRPYLDEAHRAAEMGARLNQRLMTFASQRRLDPVPVDVGALVTSLEGMITRSIGRAITLTIVPCTQPAIVLLDQSEMENAIINLAFNARDAMPQGGHLTIATREVEIGAQSAQAADVAPGRYVQLSVADTGHGMNPHVRRHAFEPFFSTKAGARNSGLGLTTIHGFVKQSGGFTEIDSVEGHGTTVTLYLPRTDARHHETGAAEAALEVTKGHGERILVVEDDASVRRVTCERLQSLGYQAIEAASGDAALQLIASGTDVDLVFSDVIMSGGMTGNELARRLREIRPHYGVLLTSGFPSQGQEEERPAEWPTLLPKPYSLQQLASAVAQLLASTRTE